MPKRYTIELRLLDDTGRQVAESSLDEEYENDDEARKGFGRKADAAKKAGKD